MADLLATTHGFLPAQTLKCSPRAAGCRPRAAGFWNMKNLFGMIVEILRHARSIKMCFILGQITHVTIFHQKNKYSIVQHFAHLGFFRYTQLSDVLSVQR